MPTSATDVVNMVVVTVLPFGTAFTRVQAGLVPLTTLMYKQNCATNAKAGLTQLLITTWVRTMSEYSEKAQTMVTEETKAELQAADRSMSDVMREGIDLALHGDTDANNIVVDLQPEIQERINGAADDTQAWIRTAIAEKLAREENHKRHLNANESISMNFTDFEARFIGDALWDIGERFEGVGWTQVDNEYKWMARRFHAECKSREEAFTGGEE